MLAVTTMGMVALAVCLALHNTSTIEFFFGGACTLTDGPQLKAS